MRILILVSSLFIIFGIVYAILAIKLNKRSLYMFFSMLFLQTGLFFLFHTLHIINIWFPQAWPLLSIFTGIALLPAGWHRYGVFKANFIVLSATFVILGAVMLIFALDLVDFSLAQFARDWWLLLLLLVVLTLALTSLGARHAQKTKK